MQLCMSARKTPLNCIFEGNEKYHNQAIQCTAWLNVIRDQERLSSAQRATDGGSRCWIHQLSQCISSADGPPLPPSISRPNKNTLNMWQFCTHSYFNMCACRCVLTTNIHTITRHRNRQYGDAFKKNTLVCFALPTV